MAVAPTGAIYKALSFDNTSSRNYGVYITGEAVYNAPERDVEMIDIPGRNGAYALDNGRFQNIEVTYFAGITADTEADFRQAISDFRNFLCSKKGYVRLSDDYNPDEYRMAIYKSGLEVTPAQLRAGEFDITFECKPQRFLISGETPLDVSNGDTILNPTLFEASPLLAVEGYGNIQLNGYDIDIADGFYGNIAISPSFYYAYPLYEGRSVYNTVDVVGKVNTGNMFTDTVTSKFYWSIKGNDLYSLGMPENLTVTDANGAAVSDTSVSVRKVDRKNIEFTVRTSIQWAYGTGIYVSKERKINFDSDVTPASDSAPWSDLHVEIDNFGFYGANRSDGSISVVWDIPAAIGTDSHSALQQYTNITNRIASDSGITADSTVTYLGHPTYIDCDLGEAYKESNGEYISLNAYIDLGSKLPELSSGVNEVEFDNTITDLKLTPRWWKV